MCFTSNKTPWCNFLFYIFILCLLNGSHTYYISECTVFTDVSWKFAFLCIEFQCSVIKLTQEAVPWLWRLVTASHCEDTGLLPSQSTWDFWCKCGPGTGFPQRFRVSPVHNITPCLSIIIRHDHEAGLSIPHRKPFSLVIHFTYTLPVSSRFR
jgi:hypothetical protein